METMIRVYEDVTGSDAGKYGRVELCRLKLKDLAPSEEVLSAMLRKVDEEIEECSRVETKAEKRKWILKYVALTLILTCALVILAWVVPMMLLGQSISMSGWKLVVVLGGLAIMAAIYAAIVIATVAMSDRTEKQGKLDDLNCARKAIVAQGWTTFAELVEEEVAKQEEHASA